MVSEIYNIKEEWPKREWPMVESKMGRPSLMTSLDVPEYVPGRSYEEYKSEIEHDIVVAERTVVQANEKLARLYKLRAEVKEKEREQERETVRYAEREMGYYTPDHLADAESESAKHYQQLQDLRSASRGRLKALENLAKRPNLREREVSDGVVCVVPTPAPKPRRGRRSRGGDVGGALPDITIDRG